MSTYRYGQRAIEDQITLTSSLNSYVTTIEASSLTSDKMIVVPNKDGTIITTGDTGSVNSTMLKTTVDFKILDSTGGTLTEIYGAGE